MRWKRRSAPVSRTSRRSPARSSAPGSSVPPAPPVRGPPRCSSRSSRISTLRWMRPMLKTASVLDVIGVTKRFTAPDGVSPLTAIERVSLTVRAGEFVAVVGPSGCGKSTILNLVAGLDRPSEGRILLNQVPVEGPNPTVGFMLQKDLLLPWRTIVRNVEFGLEARSLSRAARRERALRELRRCRLHDFAASYPYQLSGGMRQRPGRIVEEIPVDLPDRDDPMARISAPRARGYVDRLLASLHLQEKAA